MIEISGQIGYDLTYDGFRSILAEQSGDIELMINSEGGVVNEGIGIYNSIMEYDGQVTAYISGLAASIASIIAMAADKVVIYSNSQFMIHKPWTIAAGNSDDFRRLSSVLDLLDNDLARIYSARTGKPESEILDMMTAETYFDAQSTVDEGFADELKVVAKRGDKKKPKAQATVASVSWASCLARASVIKARADK